MKMKFFFCQFPYPWALRVSGMGGYISKCEKGQNHCTLSALNRSEWEQGEGGEGGGKPTSAVHVPSNLFMKLKSL